MITIKLEKTDSSITNKKFSADFKHIPGSPPLGFGETVEEAVANLFHVTLYNHQNAEQLVKLLQQEINAIKFEREY